MKSVTDVVNHLKLIPHPEGGYYLRTYESEECIQTDRGERFSTTAIYYCLPINEFSAFHKLNGITETLFFHEGNALDVYTINVDGSVSTQVLGPLDEQGDLRISIPPNCYFALRPKEGGGKAYTLISCQCTPGFDFDDFTLADQSLVNEVSPEWRDLVQKLIVR